MTNITGQSGENTSRTGLLAPTPGEHEHEHESESETGTRATGSLRTTASRDGKGTKTWDAGASDVETPEEEKVDFAFLLPMIGGEGPYPGGAKREWRGSDGFNL
ncbi:Protein STE50 [Sphaceloma murrayae]|uniref:Protein STE50 n=1 Tax=Sphaceloma murrayae TaxID=2082308 RepID=A0A2K1QUP4_9PEZI|nr:Protein STE50 [Sphaceloma murrayae]